VVRHIADRIAIMYLGRIVEHGPTADIFANPAHPYTRALVEGVPKPDPDRRRTEVTTIGGEVPSLIRRPPGCEFAARCPRAQDACRIAKPPHVQITPDHGHACLFPLERTKLTTETT
jgi:peptide/nickel transport system ATP-binding protein